MTGAFVFIGSHFAQVLEGPTAAVEFLMNSILVDERHHQVDILQTIEIRQRSFASWAMSYSEPLSYLALHMHPLLRGSHGMPRELEAADQLIEVMRELTA